MFLTLDDTNLQNGMLGIGQLSLSHVQSGPIPTLKIPLVSGISASRGIAPATFTRNSSATYIDANGVLQTAAIDVPRFQNGRYLVEPPATNIFLQSGIPETQTITVVSGSVYTVQCFGAGNITLSGAGTGTVVQGTPITFTASSTSLICTVTGSLSRAQVELGPKATSYIPTTIAPLGRVPDVLHYDVSSVITQGQGSLYCEADVVPSGVVQRLLYLSDNSISNRVVITLYSNSFLSGFVRNSLAAEATITNSLVLSGRMKCLLSYGENNVSFYVNGVKIGTDLTCVVPTNLSKLSIGCNFAGTEQLNSEIGNIKYFKEVLTPAEAIKLTTV